MSDRHQNDPNEPRRPVPLQESGPPGFSLGTTANTRSGTMTTPAEQTGTEASRAADAVEELARIIAGHVDRQNEDRKVQHTLDAAYKILRPVAERLYPG